MRDFKIHLVPDPPMMALLTAQDILEEGPMSIADFRDTHALIFRPTGSYISFNKSTGIHLGMKPSLVNGIWMVTADWKSQPKFESVKLRPDLLSLELIKLV